MPGLGGSGGVDHTMYLTLQDCAEGASSKRLGQRGRIDEVLKESCRRGCETGRCIEISDGSTLLMRLYRTPCPLLKELLFSFVTLTAILENEEGRDPMGLMSTSQYPPRAMLSLTSSSPARPSPASYS